MRNKQAIEDLAARVNQILDFLHNDIDSGKPHMTPEYAKQQLGQSLIYMESLRQYLDLEN
ncbi:hypothetical protein UFOVP450_136 [uncultured Caudovirales phage]|uniref:Uncharacterized protein n=1 Tax=uncultured Caudovirales phage TaxID=2100421 RepID=A0A6J5MEH3_9CAUD|nr:hypothetical protein UFOVP450_136 [uncultured Caudovirales phage]